MVRVLEQGQHRKGLQVTATTAFECFLFSSSFRFLSNQKCYNRKNGFVLNIKTGLQLATTTAFECSFDFFCFRFLSNQKVTTERTGSFRNEGAILLEFFVCLFVLFGFSFFYILQYMLLFLAIAQPIRVAGRSSERRKSEQNCPM